jgi:hypothetical protein
MVSAFLADVAAEILGVSAFFKVSVWSLYRSSSFLTVDSFAFATRIGRRS